MMKQYVNLPPLPPPANTREQNEENARLYRENREIYKEMTGVEAPSPQLPEPPFPPPTDDHEMAARFRELYWLLCHHYYCIMGRWPSGYLSKIPA